MILRPYQREAVARVLPLLRAGRRVCLVAPTGSGKTVMGAAVVASLGMSARWTAHRRELIAQAKAKVPATCGVFSVQERRTHRSELLVIDEAHHSTSASYRRHIDAHEGPIIGLTATPYRLDGRGLGEVFQELAVATSPAELVAAGTLIEPRYFSVGGKLDASKFRKVAGDYRQDDIAAAMDRPKCIGDAVTEYRERTPGTRAVAFCVNIEHAMHVASAFRDAGIPAEHVEGESKDRDGILKRLASGQTKVVANCMILTEGWDLPALETAIILRPTTSLCLHLQMLGRVMRACEGKRGATVLDHAGNVKRLGRATDPVEFSLDGRAVRPSSATGLKTCPNCYAIIPVAVNPCECGFLWGAEEQRELIVGGIGGVERLEEVAKPIHVYAPDVWDDSVRTTRGIGAAKWAYKERTGQWPLVAVDGRLLDPLTEEGRKRFYFEMLELASKKGRDLGSAAHMYRARYAEWPQREWRTKYEEWKAIRSGT